MNRRNMRCLCISVHEAMLRKEFTTSSQHLPEVILSLALP